METTEDENIMNALYKRDEEWKIWITKLKNIISNCQNPEFQEYNKMLLRDIEYILVQGVLRPEFTSPSEVNERERIMDEELKRDYENGEPEDCI